MIGGPEGDTSARGMTPADGAAAVGGAPAAIETGFGRDRTYHSPAPAMVTATTATRPINSPRDSVSRRSLMLMRPTLGSDRRAFCDGRHARHEVAPGRETCLHPAM